MKKSIIVAMLAVMGMTACGKRVDNAQDAQVDNGLPAVDMLAGSELKDVEPSLQSCANQAGLSLNVRYQGSLDAVDTVSTTNNYAFVWLSHGKYISLNPDTSNRILASEKIMYSRVVLGVKPQIADKFGWKSGQVSWKYIQDKIKKGEFNFAMTNPAGSNTGFVTLLGLASAFSGKGEALEVSDIPHEELNTFFKGQLMSAGSSGDLMQKYTGNPGAVDGVFNYEAGIRNVTGPAALTVIIPKEGVVTADYPFMLLDKSKRDAYNKIVACLRSDVIQKQLTATGRQGLKQDSDVIVNELTFPGKIEVIDALLDGFMNKYARPSTSLFVVDNSGSMAGERIEDMQQSMLQMSKGDATVVGRFSKFRNNEQIYIASFSDVVGQFQRLVLTNDVNDNNAKLVKFADIVKSMKANGGTAIYDSLLSAQQVGGVEKKKETGPVSIVLLTDGENTDGINIDQYEQEIKTMANIVPVYPIVYGDANFDEMTRIAAATGGKVFDARKASLLQILRQIRAYQ